MFEKRIEQILQISPELIDPSFAGCKVETQITRGSSRLDLLIKKPRGYVIVEIKKTVLSPKHIEQLLTYCRKWALDKEKRILHNAYLVGFKPLDETPLIEFSAKSVFKIHLRYIGEHVPSYVKAKQGGGYEKWRENLEDKIAKLLF